MFITDFHKALIEKTHTQHFQEKFSEKKNFRPKKSINLYGGVNTI